MAKIKIDSFLILERTLTRKLIKTWRPIQASFIIRALDAIRQDDNTKLEDLMQDLDFSKVLRSNKRFVRFIGMAAFIFGVGRFGDQRNSVFVKGKRPIPLLKEATNTLIDVIAVAGTINLKKKVNSAIVFIKEREKERGDRKFKADIIRSNREILNQAAGRDAEQYLSLVSSLHNSRLAAWGYVQEADALGFDEYVISEQIDSKTICPICTEMHGKKFKVSSAASQLEALLTVDNFDDLKQLAPWPKQTKQGIKDFQELSDEELIANGWNFPPYHPLCRGLIVEVGSDDAKPLKPPAPAIDATTIAETIGIIGGAGLLIHGLAPLFGPDQVLEVPDDLSELDFITPTPGQRIPGDPVPLFPAERRALPAGNLTIVDEIIPGLSQIDSDMGRRLFPHLVDKPDEMRAALTQRLAKDQYVTALARRDAEILAELLRDDPHLIGNPDLIELFMTPMATNPSILRTLDILVEKLAESGMNPILMRQVPLNRLHMGSDNLPSWVGPRVAGSYMFLEDQFAVIRLGNFHTFFHEQTHHFDHHYNGASHTQGMMIFRQMAGRPIVGVTMQDVQLEMQQAIDKATETLKEFGIAPYHKGGPLGQKWAVLNAIPFEKSGRISAYSLTNDREWLAEAGAVYYSGQEGRDTLKRLLPVTFKLLDDINKGKLPERLFAVNRLPGDDLLEEHSALLLEKKFIKEALKGGATLTDAQNRQFPDLQWGNFEKTVATNNFSPVEPNVFHQAISQTKQTFMVEVKSLEDYVQIVADGGELFVLELPGGGSVGFVIKADGDLVSVFNTSGVKGISPILLVEAIKRGATKLDAFDSHLVDIYSKAGFKTVNALEWDDKFAPPNWPYKSRPDIIFMVRDLLGGNLNDLAKNYGTYPKSYGINPRTGARATRLNSA